MIGVMLGVGFIGFVFIGGFSRPSRFRLPGLHDPLAGHEGLNLASTVKAQVAEFCAQSNAGRTGRPGRSAVSGTYVESVVVASGSVVITYGEAANQNIRGQRSPSSPSVDQSGDIYWACGNASAPQG